MRPSRRTRRVFLLAAVLLLFGLTVRANEERLPIFDTHLHYSRSATHLYRPEAVLRLLREAYVPRALVFSSPDDGTLALHAFDSARFVPFLRPYRQGVGPGNWVHDAATPAYLEQRLRRNTYAGIGEFHLYRAEAARSPVVRKVAALAARHGLFLHVHAGAEAVDALIGLEPGLKVLWAHAGMTTPVADIRRMLRRHGRLWAELSYREHGILNAEGRVHTLDPAWKALLLEFHDRLMVGSDTWADDRWEEYGAILETHRTWLRLIPRDKARNIAYRNAARLFGRGALPR